LRDQQKATDLRAALADQIKQVMPDASDAEIERHVEENLAKMLEVVK
jgi:hypothetical protein